VKLILAFMKANLFNNDSLAGPLKAASHILI
jgi:hypothetical protein